ncbi:uroporphyrinogen-III C-methyltransferase [Robertkochia solimangrovi]|uniref:uroporphyrinogen-III C-methyltransferase n=1 Tax=Robertkochia solimangrovi TaxID=2213046 RepID=UPI001F551227|nr:uroporphyrinogen-III C-methyltransferase [Robertkochia solimangrovi]
MPSEQKIYRMQNKKNIQPRLTLVGAGPGDPDLLTVKGLKVLSRADVVLYDALIDTALLEYAPLYAELIYVGKRKGCAAYEQQQINELIVERAKHSGHVVRLKGGDPFVFGRGMEELNYAAAHGVISEFIPGISSALAVPGMQGIPLTHRGASESFWVITGTTKNHKLSDDVRLAAGSNATVVILMGMSKLAEITSIFKAEGKNDVAVAVIQNGTKKEERFAIGNVENIEYLVKENNISNPAVIIIGDVVKQRERLISIKSAVNQYSII